MNNSSPLTRRDFFGKSARLGAVGLLAPNILP